MKNNFTLLLIVGLALLASCKNDPKKDVLSTEPTAREISILDSLIQEEPRNADLYYDRALYYYNNGNSPKAQLDIYNALTIDSANADYYFLGGDIFIDMGEIQKANALMAKAIYILPENEALHLRAIEYNLYIKNYPQALNYTSNLINLNKYNADAYFFRGLVFKEMGEKDKAINNFQTCVEMDPEYYNAYMQMGLLYSKDKDDVALQYFKNALRIQENSREALYAIAYHYQNEEKYNEAISEYKKMVQLDPKDHEVFFNIGHCYIKVDSLDKAYKNFDIATKMNPQYTGAYYMKGNVSEMLGNRQDALVNYKQALKLLPEDEKIQEAVKRLE